MAIKRTITKEEYNKLIPILQAEYKADGENMVLDLTDFEDPTKLRQAKDAERDLKKAALAEKAALQTALDALTEERDGLLRGSIPKADAEKLEGSYKSKLEKQKTELQAKIDAATASIQKLLVDNVATTMAAEISTSPALIIPHIKSRLRAEMDANGEFVTKVVDKEGLPSALTVEELNKEFCLNSDFKAIITASKASGGGAGGGGSGGGAGGAGGGKVDWSGNAKSIAANLKGRLQTHPGSVASGE